MIEKSKIMLNNRLINDFFLSLRLSISKYDSSIYMKPNKKNIVNNNEQKVYIYIIDKLFQIGSPI